jgi:hypothetical protein
MTRILSATHGDVTAMVRKPTPQGISALLSRAGFTRSTESRSRIKGLTECTAGYVVRRNADGAVVVFHRPSSLNRGDATTQVREKIAAYAGTLDAAGYMVAPSRQGNFTISLIVCAKET